MTDRPFLPPLSLSQKQKQLTDGRLVANKSAKELTVPSLCVSVVVGWSHHAPIEIDLCYETSDADLAQALEQNPFVTEIALVVDMEQRTDWDSLLRVIATRANLEEVIVWDATNAEERIAPGAALIRSILQAVQQNTAIRTVGLTCLCISTDIATFVDNASSIKLLRLSDCNGEQGARDLAAALQRNKNIQSLELDKLNDITLPILEALSSNVSLKTLIFRSMYSDSTPHALQHLLASTTSIQRLEWHEFAFTDERLTGSLAQAITSSESVSELAFFDWCQGFGRNTCAQLQSILRNKRNLSALCLDSFLIGAEEQVHEDIVSALLRPDSRLQCLELNNSVRVDAIIPNTYFATFLGAIEKSKLERFQIGSIVTPHQLQTLTQSIPSMKVKELEIRLTPSFAEALKQDLLRAVENNFTLRSVKGKLPNGTDFFDSDDDKQRLAFYANRNESLDQWVDNPETVEQGKVWPEALSLAERAGPNALFCGLRSVLERDYVSLPGGRKRKRPQYYAPS